MFLFKKKNLWILALIILSVYFSYLHVKTTGDYIAAKREEKDYINKIAHENTKKEELDKQEEKANSQKNIESVARSDLNYLKDGEILFIDGDKQ